MPTILITGGTGLVGKALTKELSHKKYNVIILSRAPEKKTPMPGITYAHWNVEQQTIDEDAVAAADYIIHLAGAGIADKRWTKKRKQEIVHSRVESGTLLCKTLQKKSDKLKAFISASAIGWYGPDPALPNPAPFTEDVASVKDFLGSTCLLWEQSVQPVRQLGKRLVILRTGIVLSRDGGALKEFTKPIKLGVAAIMGSGKQMLSWIHIDDLVKIYVKAIEQQTYSGVYNAVAPIPVSNEEFITRLAEKMKGTFYTKIRIPAVALKLILGEMSMEVLKSATVSSEKIIQNDYFFQYPSMSPALAHLTARIDT